MAQTNTCTDPSLINVSMPFDDPGRFAGIAYSHHRCPVGGRDLLRQLSSHELRADGRGRARGDHRRQRQVSDQAIPSAGCTLRLASMADLDHGQARPASLADLP
jgi:hypothetical protein